MAITHGRSAIEIDANIRFREVLRRRPVEEGVLMSCLHGAELFFFDSGRRFGGKWREIVNALVKYFTSNGAIPFETYMDWTPDMEGYAFNAAEDELERNMELEVSTSMDEVAAIIANTYTLAMNVVWGRRRDVVNESVMLVVRTMNDSYREEGSPPYSEQQLQQLQVLVQEVVTPRPDFAAIAVGRFRDTQAHWEEKVEANRRRFGFYEDDSVSQITTATAVTLGSVDTHTGLRPPRPPARGPAFTPSVFPVGSVIHHPSCRKKGTPRLPSPLAVPPPPEVVDLTMDEEDERVLVEDIAQNGPLSGQGKPMFFIDLTKE